MRWTLLVFSAANENVWNINSDVWIFLIIDIIYAYLRVLLKIPFNISYASHFG